MIDSACRLLVIGGNGFIGSHIINRALKSGFQVTSLNRSLPPATKRNPVIQYLVADITNIEALTIALNNTAFTYVVNCGGCIDHTLFANGGSKVINNHFFGVLNLVEVLNRDALQSFINIGSSDEYGANPPPQTENLREAPISPYAQAKVATAHFLQMLYRTEQFPATTLRLFLTFGPGQDKTRFLPQIILGCLTDSAFPTSEGGQLRDFCYIDDMVNAVFKAFKKPDARGEIINIASGHSVSIRYVIETVSRLIGSGRPQFGKIAYRIGENMALYANIEKAKVLLDWAPEICLEDGLNKTIQWIREQ